LDEKQNAFLIFMSSNRDIIYVLWVYLSILWAHCCRHQAEHEAFPRKNSTIAACLFRIARLMIGLIQRVSHAKVVVDGASTGEIGAGILALIGVQRGDTEGSARRLLERILAYRVFPDTRQHMNLSLADTGGGLLLVPQFTLAANTQKGNRASFTPAAAPGDAQALFLFLVSQAQQTHSPVASGIFGADMQVHLVNDGPVTFWLQTPTGL
jgi:D-tyrosyl-tRNA(Tyr) deacylase